MAKEQYVVTVDRPRNVTVLDMKEYIDGALNSWWGQFCPPGNETYFNGDPRWGLKFTNIKRMKKE